MPSSKLVIGNLTALRNKYGAALPAIQAALGRLVAADAARGITTTLVWIDDAGQMGGFGGAAVAGPADEPGAKAAVDAAFAALTPDYILLLDGPDVVPHIALDQPPGVNDQDLNVPSDLPYACAAPFSRLITDFLGVTRVVGRLPATPGAADPETLIGLIDTAAGHAPMPPSAFTPPFAISADVWIQSTRLSIANVFGAGQAVLRAPPAGHPSIDPDLSRLAHFINCHGDTAIDEFYGESLTAPGYPVAMKSGKAAPQLQRGTVTAAECCYGAELYDPQLAGTGAPICMGYMQRGAAAYVGSTNIAYGPASGNGAADLITQYFLGHVLRGASAGRALLQARQDFVRKQMMADPINLKTLGQFLLFGDPAVQPCIAPGLHAATPLAHALTAASEDLVDLSAQRKARRVALHGEGLAVAATATRPGEVMRPADALAGRLADILARHGFDGNATVMSVEGGPLYTESAHALGDGRKVAMAMRELPTPAGRSPSYEALVVHIVGERVIRVEDLVSR